MEIEPTPLMLSKTRKAQKALSISIPSFRRVESFVGREEGFDLFDPSNDLELPSPKIMENIQYRFGEPHQEEPRLGTLNFECANVCANVNNSEILGAIPQVQHPDFAPPAPKIVKEPLPTPAALKKQEPVTNMDNEISIGTYTRAQRKQKLARYRKKRYDRLYGPKVQCKYKCRQKFAKNRPRVHGRFVKLS